MRRAAVFADAALRRVLEVIDRRRPAAQLRPLLAPSLVDSVLSAGRRSPGRIGRRRGAAPDAGCNPSGDTSRHSEIARRGFRHLQPRSTGSTPSPAGWNRCRQRRARDGRWLPCTSDDQFDAADDGGRSSRVSRMDGNTVSVERVIKAPPDKIFALVADAGKHASIDGSESVNHATERRFRCRWAPNSGSRCGAARRRCLFRTGRPTPSSSTSRTAASRGRRRRGRSGRWPHLALRT